MAFRLIYLHIFFTFISGCVATDRYTSLDLSVMPCEQNVASRFFYPIEFDRLGDLKYASQLDSLKDRVSEAGDFKNLIFFVHGWNKNPHSAENDYQDFLCRLRTHLRIQEELDVEDKTLMVGLFWPSTITGKPTDPYLLKPISYYKIRNRIDSISESSVPEYLLDTIRLIDSSSRKNEIDITLIGHSFGGRLLINVITGESRVLLVDRCSKSAGNFLSPL